MYVSYKEVSLFRGALPFMFTISANYQEWKEKVSSGTQERKSSSYVLNLVQSTPAIDPRDHE